MAITPSITNVEAAAEGRFDADIIQRDLLAEFVSCDCRREFTRPMRARFADLTAQLRVEGLAARLARVTLRIQPPSTMLSDAGPDTRRTATPKGDATLCTGMSPNRGSDPRWRPTYLARESKRLAASTGSTAGHLLPKLPCVNNYAYARGCWRLNSA